MKKILNALALTLLTGLVLAQDTGGVTGGDAMTGGEEVTVASTLELLGDELTNVSVRQRALSNIENWQAQLAASDDPALQSIAELLGELGTALNDNPVDTQEVSGLLVSLGENTTAAAENAEEDLADQLTELGALLTNAGQSLVGDVTGGNTTGGMDTVGELN